VCVQNRAEIIDGHLIDNAARNRIEVGHVVSQPVAQIMQNKGFGFVNIAGVSRGNPHLSGSDMTVVMPYYNVVRSFAYTRNHNLAFFVHPARNGLVADNNFHNGGCYGVAVVVDYRYHKSGFVRRVP
jgi:hypothetical protein